MRFSFLKNVKNVLVFIGSMIPNQTKTVSFLKELAKVPREVYFSKVFGDHTIAVLGWYQNICIQKIYKINTRLNLSRQCLVSG